MKAKTFTEEEAAQQMGISAGTLGRWRRERRHIRYWRQCGRLIKYTKEDIDLNLQEMSSVRPKIVEHSSVTEARFG